VFANEINFISFIDLRQVSPGLKSLLEVIPLLKILTPSLWINIAAAAVEVNIASEPHASSSITSSGMFLSKRNLFSPFKTAISPANGSNCLNKKPINTAELIRLFRLTYKKHGKKIPKMGPDAQAVIRDMETDINMPFVLNIDKSGMIDMVAKTVMRKKDFKTSNPKLNV